MNAAAALAWGAGQLAALPSPRLEARLLLADALGVTPETLLGARDRAIPPDAHAAYAAAIARRAAHVPLALIRGRREFWSLDLAVSAATLIPRPESETLIEAALAAFPDHPPGRVLDLGTGTGCLLLAALSEYPAAFGVGIDRVPEAATLARDNAARLGLAARTAFLIADWAAPLSGRFDLILSNPPYIRSDDIRDLMTEVAAHEPASALDGGADGLTAYRALVPALPGLLAPGGVAILELGLGQAGAVAALARAAGLAAAIRPDLAGIPRALVMRPDA